MIGKRIAAKLEPNAPSAQERAMRRWFPARAQRIDRMIEASLRKTFADTLDRLLAGDDGADSADQRP